MNVYDRAGRSLSLADVGRAGGEGTVSDVAGRSDVVAKIFHIGRLGAELQSKVAAMAASPPNDPSYATRRHRSIAWVADVLYADPSATRFVGFTMPRVDLDVFQPAHTYYDPSDRLRRFGGGYTWRHLLTAAFNLTSAVAAVHEQGHRVGDLRETNVLVAPNSLVTLVDCDSFQIRDPASGRVYPSRVGTGDYLPPELQSADFGADDHDRTHADHFALAVLLFRFLMLGVHPFQARGPLVSELPSTEAKIRAGHYPYGRRTRAVRPPEYAPAYEVLPAELRRMFKRAFVAGHGDPAARPDAHEWLGALSRAGSQLRDCGANPNHAFIGSVCPWCRAAQDPFPRYATAGEQIALRRTPKAVPATQRREQLRTYVRMALVDGAVSEAEAAHLRKLGADLGLRPTQVEALVREERVPAFAPSPPRLEPPPSSWRWMLRSALVPCVVLAGAVAPVLAVAALALLATPALASWRETLDGAAGVPRVKRAARVLVNTHRSLVLAVQVLVPFVLAAALPVWAIGRFVSVELAARIAGAGANAWWLWFGLRRQEPVAQRASEGAGALTAMLTTAKGWPNRTGRAGYTVVLLLAGAVVFLPALGWPLPI